MGNGQCRRFRQWPARPRRRDSSRDRLFDRLHDPSDGHELACQPIRQRRILADRHALPMPPPDLIANGRLPRGASVLGGIPQERQGRRTGRGEDANSRCRPGRDDRGLAPIPPRDPLAPFRGERRFASQEERTIKNDTRRSRCHTSRRHIGPNPTANPDREVSLGKRRLQKHERGLGSSPTARLVADDDQPGDPGRNRATYLGSRRRFPQDQPAGLVNRSVLPPRNRARHQTLQGHRQP